MLLVNVQIRPVGKRRLIKLTHLWVLSKHVKRVGVEPRQGRRLKFIGSVYAYFRLGGKSKQRGLKGTHDFSILPLEAVDIQTIKPGINARYENKADSSDTGATVKEEGGSDPLGEGTSERSKHSNRRRRNHRTPKPRSGDRDRKSVNDRHTGSTSPGSTRKSKSSNPKGGPKNPRN